jgi:hypothetical protein
MRFISACFRALRPFSGIWTFLLATALLLTFGFGGGTPTSAIWLVIKLSLLGVLGVSLLVAVVVEVWSWLTVRA